MRQDKDRAGKWMLMHHGDAILTLAGLTGFGWWQSVQAETVAPRRLPDGLHEAEYRAEGKAEGLAEGARTALQGAVVAALETRFGALPAERVAPVRAIADESRLNDLLRLAVRCADLDAFTAALASGT